MSEDTVENKNPDAEVGAETTTVDTTVDVITDSAETGSLSETGPVVESGATDAVVDPVVNVETVVAVEETSAVNVAPVPDPSTIRLHEKPQMSKNERKQAEAEARNKATKTNKGPVVEPVKAAEVVVATEQNVSQFDAAVAELKRDGTQSEKILIASLETYMASMKPGMPVTSERGSANQYGLLVTINTVLNNSPAKEFKMLWNILLGYFDEYKNGVFHDRYIFRFAEDWNKGEDELHALQRILNLIKLTCDSKTRENGLKQIDLDRTLAVGFSEEARQRVLAFYGK